MRPMEVDSRENREKKKRKEKKRKTGTREGKGLNERIKTEKEGRKKREEMRVTSERMRTW